MIENVWMTLPEAMANTLRTMRDRGEMESFAIDTARADEVRVTGNGGVRVDRIVVGATVVQPHGEGIAYVDAEGQVYRDRAVYHPDSLDTAPTEALTANETIARKGKLYDQFVV